MSLSSARSRRRWGEKGRGAVAWEWDAQQVHPQRRVLDCDNDLRLWCVLVLWPCAPFQALFVAKFLSLAAAAVAVVAAVGPSRVTPRLTKVNVNVSKYTCSRAPVKQRLSEKAQTDRVHAACLCIGARAATTNCQHSGATVECSGSNEHVRGRGTRERRRGATARQVGR
jgi:hypothetical protein